MSYLVLSPARDDLDGIEDWIVANFGEAHAEKVLDALLATFEMLAEYPAAGIEQPDILEPPFRFFYSRLNWIVYEPGDPLIIHRVFPARMDIRDFTLGR